MPSMVTFTPSTGSSFAAQYAAVIASASGNAATAISGLTNALHHTSGAVAQAYRDDTTAASIAHKTPATAITTIPDGTTVAQQTTYNGNVSTSLTTLNSAVTAADTAYTALQTNADNITTAFNGVTGHADFLAALTNLGIADSHGIYLTALNALPGDVTTLSALTTSVTDTTGSLVALNTQLTDLLADFE